MARPGPKIVILGEDAQAYDNLPTKDEMRPIITEADRRGG